MRIRELQIERFGIWENVSLPFSERDVTVLYGPNEAGKSTLMRFIRGVLFGFEPTDERTGGPHWTPPRSSGSLTIIHDGQEYRLKRTSRPGMRGDLEINGRPVADDDPLVQAITGGVSETLFQNIFAVGLQELQQLATLDGEEVARHIYSLSLGPEGKQIFRAQAGCDQAERDLLGDGSASGEIQSLLQQLAQVDRELADLGSPRARHAELEGQLGRLEAEIDERKEEQARLKQNLRGHQLLRKIWEPWKKERSLRRQLDRLPEDDIDRDALDRFDELELELEELEDRRNKLIEESRRLLREAREIEIRPELDEHGCTIQRLSEQSGEMASLERTLGDGTRDAQRFRSHSNRSEQPRTNGRGGHGAAPEQAVEALLAELPGRWDLNRLERADVSPEGVQRLLESAHRFRQTRRTGSRLQRRYKQDQAELPELERQWAEQAQAFGTESPAEARKTLQQRLHDLEELRGLRMRQQHLVKANSLFSRDWGDVTTVEKDLPGYFWAVIWFFVVTGVSLLAGGLYAAFHGYAGIVAGGPTAWIAGGCLSLIGLAALGIGWTMKQHFGSQEVCFGDLRSEKETVRRELVRVEKGIDRITRKDAFRPPLSETVPADGQAPDVTEEELIERTRAQLAKLDEFEQLGERIEQLRTRLARMRQALQKRQRQTGQARQRWSETLRQNGLEETLKLSEAVDQCERILAARQAWADSLRSEPDQDRLRRELENFLSQVDELASLLERPGFHVRDPYRLVEEWERQRRQQAERRRERSRLRKSARKKQHEAARMTETVEQRRQQRTKLLRRLGVASRKEITARLAALEERAEIERQLETARRELESLIREEPELAIVEEDLLNYEDSNSRETIDGLQDRIDRIEASLQRDYERIGQVKQELRLVVQDRRHTSLRFERAQIEESLRAAAERWSAVRLTGRLIDQLRQRIERDRQPDTLRHASEYLRRLTCGRYRNIWTPLGERVLLIDEAAEGDDGTLDMEGRSGVSLRVEQLSSGTREQVFLAIRMAMVRDFAARGIELPLILDDVTVNFDQIRTEAAVETLLNVAEQGQQIMLFTCHLHLAHLFEADGIEPLWLPSQRPAHVA
jgi:uncharacterized protein YhaN